MSQRINQDSPKGRKPFDCPKSILWPLLTQHPNIISARLSSHRGSSVVGGKRCTCAFRRRVGAGYTARQLTRRCYRFPFRGGEVCTVTVYTYYLNVPTEFFIFYSLLVTYDFSRKTVH